MRYVGSGVGTMRLDAVNITIRAALGDALGDCRSIWTAGCNSDITNGVVKDTANRFATDCREPSTTRCTWIRDRCNIRCTRSCIVNLSNNERMNEHPKT
eukprot:3542171-Pyramimonas_sp.AAC.1